MMMERGRVVAVSQDAIWIRIVRSSSCGQCGAGDECGTGLIDRWINARMTDIRIRRTDNTPVCVGDQAQIGIEDHAVLRASLIGYGLPLLGLLLGAVLGAAVSAGDDAVSMLAGFSGLIAGLVGARWLAVIGLSRSEPELLRVIPAVTAESNLIGTG